MTSRSVARLKGQWTVNCHGSRRVAIREAATGDTSLVARTVRESFLDVAERFGLTPENCPTHPSNCTNKWIERSIMDGTAYYILEEGDTACGSVAMARVSERVRCVEKLAVLPDCRRRGFGDALLRHVLDEAARAGANSVQLSIIAEHDDLRRWYETRGFVVLRTTIHDHPRSSAVRRLDNGS